MKNLKVLIAENESIVAKDLESRLKLLGHSISAVVNSGARAIEQANATRPDVALMDIHLKGDMDGIEAAQQIRKRFDIPSIYITVDTNEQTITRAKATEPLGYLIKPFGRRDLNIALEMALQKLESEKILRQHSSAFQSMTDAVIATDPKGRITSLNPSAERMGGLKLQDSIWQFLEGPFASLKKELFWVSQKADPSQKQNGAEETPVKRGFLINAEGNRISIEGKIAPIQGTSGPLGMVFVLRRVKNEEFASFSPKNSVLSIDDSFDGLWDMNLILCDSYAGADSLKEETAEPARSHPAKMAEETGAYAALPCEKALSLLPAYNSTLKQALAVIAENSESILWQLPNSKQFPQLQEIYQTAHTLKRLLKENLPSQPRQMRLDLNEYLRKKAVSLQQNMKGGIKVITYLSTKPLKVHIDRDCLDEVISSLVLQSEALESQAGQIILGTTRTTLDSAYIKNHSGVTAGNYALLVLGIIGPGITANFDKYTFHSIPDRQPSSVSNVPGFAHARTVMKQHGCHIDFQNQTGLGNTFRIFFPQDTNSSSKPPKRKREYAKLEE